MTTEDKEFMMKVFEGYQRRKIKNNLYYSDSYIPENIILSYYTYIEGKTDLKKLVDFKKNYIYNESRVEDNSTIEEQKGMSEVYEYISNFNYNQNNFNIFVQAMYIHQKLYSKCKDTSFGGKLRDTDAYLYNSVVDILPPKEALKFFQSYLGNSNIIMDRLKKENIISYINECVKITTELIKVQPFFDGNKRTFRALLNLMFKIRNLPPVYITIEEKDEYKDALLKAMSENDYQSLYKFYYYKICDSLYELVMSENIVKKDSKKL